MQTAPAPQPRHGLEVALNFPSHHAYVADGKVGEHIQTNLAGFMFVGGVRVIPTTFDTESGP